MQWYEEIQQTEGNQLVIYKQQERWIYRRTI